MGFKEFTYSRPEIHQIEETFRSLLEEFRSAESAEAQDAKLAELNNLRQHVQSMNSLVEIRHTVDTRDEYYETESDYFDQIGPRMKALNTEFYESIVSSEYRAHLEDKWGKQLFTLADLNLRTFSPDVMEDLKRENELSSEYTKLFASAEIEFDGEKRNLSQMGPYQQSTDREVRKAAEAAKWSFFAANSEKLDNLYDELVKVRTGIAHKLGYENFVELGYARMERSDYDQAKVANFRKQVEELIVPVATKLKARQQARIGVDHLYHYDEAIGFASGNPNPHGSPEWIVENGRKMYEELSQETNKFFTYMIENDLMDLVSKTGKAVGGYCTSLPEFEAPFIFSNFNGTLGDITVLTHEAGHAFQCYESLKYPVPEYGFPTSESAEIHSMSMEFFTWPWMDLFFEEETEKFKFMHLADSLLFLPYGVAVDEFQHMVYSRPEVTPAERKAMWREVEQKYMPHRDYGDNEFLSSGGFWQKQIHIYGMPFYYIDYTLAQICAFQFWKRANEDRDAAWKDYLHLCQLGGSQSFLTLVNEAGLISPFEDGCVASVIGEIETWLDSVDEKAL